MTTSPTVNRRSPNEISEMIDKLDEDYEKNMLGWTDSARRALRWVIGETDETPRWNEGEA
jgi:hypothetical protein